MNLDSSVIIAIKLFAIMDPFSIIPYLLAIFEEYSQSSDTKVSWKFLVNKVELAVLILLLFFSVIGRAFLDFLGLSPESLEIGGGIILIYLGIDTMGGFQQLRFLGRNLVEAAVTPIATPLIVGPGTMAALVTLSVTYGIIYLILGSLIAAVLTYIVLRSGPLLVKALGRTGTVAAGRFTAIIIAAFGVQLILQGISQIKLA
ncbi:MarC family protein [Acidianus sp. RZ1]|uniref:MarC family protein n=1 Tax=Acidianus sp. RZ1 TaxID=1540082 RepID=UPI0014916E4D|nr:MarC family protein [Acidianus sp. RZ1]NON62779.1 MarC family protein [Acidianus sp. RZ1]